MAFTAAALRRVGFGVSNSIWHYASAGDATAACDTAAFFNLAAGRLKINDIIFVTPTSAPNGILVVNANTRDMAALPPVAGVVDTTSTTAIGTADSD